MWINPIFDRSATDIANRTAKAFFNLADWSRINGNSTIIQELINNLFGVNVNLIALAAPTITTFPTAAAINSLIQNIETLRLASNLPTISAITPLPCSYGEGLNATVPDYNAINAWESNQHNIYNMIILASNYWPHCGVGACGQSHFWQTRFRVHS